MLSWSPLLLLYWIVLSVLWESPRYIQDFVSTTPTISLFLFFLLCLSFVSPDNSDLPTPQGSLDTPSAPLYVKHKQHHVIFYFCLFLSTGNGCITYIRKCQYASRYPERFGVGRAGGKEGGGGGGWGAEMGGLESSKQHDQHCSSGPSSS